MELDPVVHHFAEKYFNLPSNHTSIIGDAIVGVKDMQAAGTEMMTYDFIIHDVFTGGAEPIELFTQEFLQDLSNLLSQDGVIAIVCSYQKAHHSMLRRLQNYAGDLLLPSASSVVLTAKSVFPKCRLFRETAAPLKPGFEDPTNMVMFCRKTSAHFAFREPVEADYLGSGARQHHLLPEHEIEASRFEKQGNGEIIRRGRTDRLRASQMKNALGHWHVMRTVIPDIVWENW